MKPPNFRKYIVLIRMTAMGWGDLRERDHLEDVDVDGITILKYIFKKWDGET